MAWTQRWQRMTIAGGIALAVIAQGAPPIAAAGSHLIQPGETLSEIADAYGVSLDALASANGIVDYHRIYAGDELLIPGASSATVTVVTTYSVDDGETLEDIAQTLGTTPQRILETNPGITDPDVIFAGEELQIPGIGGDSLALPRVPKGDVVVILDHYAARYGLDPALVQALAWQESGWQQDVVSSSGAIGVMQLLPDTGAWLASDVVGAPLDIAGSTSDNVLGGVAFLSWLIDQTGDEQQALSIYVQGQGSIARNGVLPETQAYIDNVLAIRDHIARYGFPPTP